MCRYCRYVFTAGIAFAGGWLSAHHPPPLGCFAKELSLTDDQLVAIHRIERDRHFDKRSRIHALLTSEQLKKLEVLKAQLDH